MLRRAVCLLGTGFLLMALMVRVVPATSRASEQPAPEAEPAHAARELSANHAAGDEGEPNPLAPQPSLAIWTVVVFFGLFFVLRRYAWKPLSEALRQREEHLEHTLLQTEKMRNESEQLLADHRRLMAQADERVKSIFNKAQKDAQASGEEIVRAARAEAEAARDRAQREIAVARDQALAEIWTKTADIAVNVAGRVLSRELDQNEHRRLLDAAIQELPAVPVSSNGHGASQA